MKPIKIKTITQEFLETILFYDENEGVFIWKKRLGSSNIKIGGMAGSKTVRGYREIKILRHSYSEHRLIWLYVTGELPNYMLDHINGIRDDNRLINLRQANHQQNNRNSIGHINSKSKFKGVSANKNGWEAKIRFNGKQLYIGKFKDEFEAAYNYDIASLKYHGEYGRRNFLPLA